MTLFFIVSATYSFYFLGISVTATGLSAVILHVESVLIKTTAVAGVLLYVKKRRNESKN